MDQIIAELRKIPPVTRTICASSVLVTVSVILKLVNPMAIVYRSDFVFQRFEIWRLYTAFFLGSGGLTFLFELIMLYQVMNDLETKSYAQRSSDFAYQLFWVMASIIVLSYPLQPYIFTRAFLLAIVYLYSRLAPPGATTSIMGLVTVPIIYYPYVLIGIDLVMGGAGGAAVAVCGAIAGHVWWWAVWGGELASQGVLSDRARAPEWLRKKMGESGPRARQPTAAGGAAQGLADSGIHVTAPRRAAASGTSSGYSWGSGQRLGSS